MYDCAIIGTGIAGVSAALTLKALKRSFIVIGEKKISLKVRQAERIKNYPGLPSVSGKEFSAALSSQLEDEGIEITEGKATGVYPDGGGFNVLCGSEAFKAQTVILATGTETLKPVKGEREFLGRGVSYCAVCDGFLYRGKKIAAVLESEEDAGEVELLAKSASAVSLFTLRKGVEISAQNVEISFGLPEEIFGGERVEGVSFKGEKIAVDGVFMLKRAVAADTFLHGLEISNGAVAVDRACRTSVDGVFAAGDITGAPYQYAKAAGEGNVCAYSVNAYLNSRAKKTK